MKRSHPTFRVLASFVPLFVLTTVAQALPSRTWVAGDGNDANPCTLALPCQTFAAAILQTRDGGEINAKNAGDFGKVFIDKSITIDGGGTFAGIVDGGVSVDDSASATPDTAVVTLRNLSLNGAGPLFHPTGVSFRSGKTLNIENCRIFNFEGNGVYIFMSSTGANVNIKNTSIFACESGVVADAVGLVTVTLNRCNIENTGEGLMLNQDTHASIRDSVFQFNYVGVWLVGSSNTVNVVGSQINHNTFGLALGQGTTASIGRSTILDNSIDFSGGGTIQTFGNNETADPIPGVVNLGLK